MKSTFAFSMFTFECHFEAALPLMQENGIDVLQLMKELHKHRTLTLLAHIYTVIQSIMSMQ